jgi:ribosomal protein L37E
MKESYAETQRRGKSINKFLRDRYSNSVAKLFCPRCGTKAFNDDFTGTSKPCCLSCGWNLERAKERSRSLLKGRPIGLAMLAVFFGCIAYSSKEGFALIPFALMAGLISAVAISGWRHLRKLEAASRNAPFVDNPSSKPAVSPETKARREVEVSDELRTLSKPRRVRLKIVPKVIAIAFPISIVGALYFGFSYVRGGLLSYAPLSDVWLPMLVAFIWSAIAVQILRRAKRDSKLLAEGDLTVATVTAQWMAGGGKHQHSRISFQFRDPLGRLILGEADDDSRTLFEEMKITVVYDPINPENCVPLEQAACELVRR